MKANYAVVNTDLVNRQNLKIPVTSMAESLEVHVRVCAARDLPLGTPMHYSHDVHRPIGWSVSRSIHLGPDMARQLATLFFPDTQEEIEALAEQRAAYWSCHHSEGVEPYADALTERALPADTRQARWLRAETPAFVRPGLAAELYPELFPGPKGEVDKDGLVDYRLLLKRFNQIHPGVFEDPRRNLVLFAHRFFRRSLALENSLNTYGLMSFTDLVQRNSSLRARLRLDPDIVGHPGSGHRNIELEHWRGPPFNDDIATIPSGVAEHKASETKRQLEGIDKTQIWWKSPETRETEDGRTEIYRTFEVEELIDHYSAGLAPDTYGCRYAHAEFNAEKGFITHFDGAIRAYDAEAYLERIETAIDRSGKNAIYTKLFRLDGDLTVADWKRLLSDFYRGNDLIPEYLGGEVERSSLGASEIEADEEPAKASALKEPALSALVVIGPAAEVPPAGLLARNLAFGNDQHAPFVELGKGAVATLLRARSQVSLEAAFDDDVLNLPVMVLETGETCPTAWTALLATIGQALEADAQAGFIRRLSLALVWTVNDLMVTLSIAGNVAPAIALLNEAKTIVDPLQPPSAWIEALNSALLRHAPRLAGSGDWYATDPFSHRLIIARREQVEARLLFPAGLDAALDEAFDVSVGFDGPLHDDELDQSKNGRSGAQGSELSERD